MQTKIKLNFSFALIAHQIHTIKISSLDEFSPELSIKKKKKKKVHEEHTREKKKKILSSLYFQRLLHNKRKSWSSFFCKEIQEIG